MLRERITVYLPRPTVTDEFGDQVPSASEDSMELWAKVEAQVGKETEANGKVTYSQPYKITIRYNDQITNAGRLTWRQVGIAINSVVADVRNTEMYLRGTRVD